MTEYKCLKNDCQNILQKVGNFYICEVHGQKDLLIITPRVRKPLSVKLSPAEDINLPDKEQYYSTNLSDSIYEEKDLTQDKDKLSYVKSAISKWSNEIPNNNLTNFGEKIEIISIIEKPLYNILFETKHESRFINEERVPYSNQRIPKQEIFVKEDIDVWKYPPPENNFKDKFINNQITFKIENSQSIDICSECKGTCEKQCSRCSGFGEYICEFCRGTKEIKCYCRSGCSDCYHRGFRTCGRCNINGRRICSECKGNKKEKCVNCNSIGKVINYFSILYNYEISKQTNGVIDKKKLIDEKFILDNKNIKILLDIEENLIDLSKIEVFKYKEINKIIQSLFKLSMIPSNEISNINDKNKIIKQHLLIEKLKRIEVSYNFENEKYYLFIYDISNKIFSSNFSDPIRNLIKIKKNLEKDLEKCGNIDVMKEVLDQLKFFENLDNNIYEGIDIYINEKRTYINDMNEPLIKENIKNIGSIAGFIGSLIFMIFIWSEIFSKNYFILIFIALLISNYIIIYITSKPNNFLYFNEVFFLFFKYLPKFIVFIILLASILIFDYGLIHFLKKFI